MSEKQTDRAIAYAEQHGVGPSEAMLAIKLVDLRERADAYYRNLVALIFGARCEYTAYANKNGHDDVEAAMLRQRLRTLLAIVIDVERGEYHQNCEACAKPLIDGHRVVYYDDAGDIHANCGQPTEAMPGSHEYDSGYKPDQCAAEIEKAKAVLVAADAEPVS